MKQPKYLLTAADDFTIFEFVSEGTHGTIHKLIEFTPTEITGLYNLAFGDKDEITGAINDEVITNNGDMEKVLATVVEAVYIFTNNTPNCLVYATGSTLSRTRLYRIGISKYLDEMQKDFYIFGEQNDQWLSFESGINYDGFIIKRKKYKNSI
jgi:hypothetical protein